MIALGSDFTVLTTAYNAELTIRTALLSVLGQEEMPAKVIVVNDGSTDDTSAVVREFGRCLPIEFVDGPRVGRAVALNRGVALSQTKYVAILDADDLWLPNHLCLKRRQFDQEQRLGVAGSFFYEAQFNDGKWCFNVVSFPESDPALRSALATIGAFCHTSVAYCRQAVVDAGGFSTRLRSRIDHDLWIRIAGLGYRLGNQPEPSCLHAKYPLSYFARVNRPLYRATNMYSRGRMAISLLGLPRAQTELLIASRFLASLAPSSFGRLARSRRLSKCEWAEVASGLGPALADAWMETADSLTHQTERDE